MLTALLLIGGASACVVEPPDPERAPAREAPGGTAAARPYGSDDADPTEPGADDASSVAPEPEPISPDEPGVAGADADPDAGPAASVEEPAKIAGETVRVVRIVDGDTLIIARGAAEQRARLLNVDAPETVHPSRPVECGGPEAAAWLGARIPVGSEVTVVHDVERYDRFDRELIAVFADGSLVNAELAEAGWATAVVFGRNDTFHGAVAAAEAFARDAGRGLFAPGACP